jgi:phosphoesterase RecJ-like protein
MTEQATLRAPRATPDADPGLDAVARVIRERDRFVLTAHRNPEGDALGSSLGLGGALEEMGKQVLFYNADPVPRVLRLFPWADRVVGSLRDARAGDTVIVCDCGELERVGMRCWPAGDPLREPDHTSQVAGSPNELHRSGASATASRHRVLRRLGHRLAAWHGLCAASSPTPAPSFQWGPETFEAAAELVRAGAKPDFVSQRLFDSNEEKTLRLLALVLGSLERSGDGRIATVVVSREMFEATGTGAEHVENFVNYPRSIEGVDVAVLLRELGPDHWKVSLRGNGLVDTTAISAEWGGGGHRNASGCAVRGRLADVKRGIITRAQALL